MIKIKELNPKHNIFLHIHGECKKKEEFIKKVRDLVLKYLSDNERAMLESFPQEDILEKGDDQKS